MSDTNNNEGEIQTLQSTAHFILHKHGKITREAKQESANDTQKVQIAQTIRSKCTSVNTSLFRLFSNRQKKQSVSRFDQLPTEVLDLVFENLNKSSLLNLSAVSKKYHQLCRIEDHQWKKLFTRDFGKISTIHKESLTYYEHYRDHYKLYERMKKGKANLKYLTGHSGTVYCLTYFNGRLVSGGIDKNINIWNVETGEHEKKEGHQATVVRLKSYKDNMLSCSSDATIIVWSKDFEIVHQLQGHYLRVQDVCQAGDLIVSASMDKTVRMWDKTGKEVNLLKPCESYISALDAHDYIVAMASANSTILLYDTQKGVYLSTIKDPFNIFTAVHFDGKNVYGAGCDGRLKTWEASTGKLIGTAAVHTGVVRAFSCKSKINITCGYDKTIKFWDSYSSQCLAIYMHQESTWIMDIVSNGPYLFCAGVDGIITSLDYGYDLPAFHKTQTSFKLRDDSQITGNHLLKS